MNEVGSSADALEGDGDPWEATDSEDETTRAEALEEDEFEPDPSFFDWLAGLVSGVVPEPSEAAVAEAGEAPTDTEDPGPPYLIVDQYSGDSGPNPPWDHLAATPSFYGAIIKAWEGTAFNDGGWFQRNWDAVRLAGGDRYGWSWFRGAYLFLKFMKSGTAQADAYLRAIDQAGGWAEGDTLPIVDVELGGEKNSNRQASAERVIECVTECADRLRSESGRRVMLYGRGAMRDLGITDRMGCDVVWNPSYTARMVRNGLQAWDLEEIVLWQYCGDNFAAYDQLPNRVDGFNKIDISVFIKGAERPTLQDVRGRLLS